MSAVEPFALPFTEAEAARKLGVSKATLSRERLAGRIHPIRMGCRIIRYTDEILDAYRRRCPDCVDDMIAKAREMRQPLIREPGIYFLYDGDEVVYVGQTTNFPARIASHMFRKGFTGYSFMAASPERLDQVEADLIARLRPRLNICLNPDAFTVRRTR